MALRRTEGSFKYRRGRTSLEAAREVTTREVPVIAQ